MKYYTHLAFSFMLGILLIKQLSIKNQILYILIFMLFSLVPDIDKVNSKIGKKVKPLAFLINLILGHRGVVHSIFVPIIIYLLLFNFNMNLAIICSVGYLSHLILDCTTKSGLRFLWPLKKKLKGFIKTGSIVENVLFVIFLIIDVYLLINF
jgi:inner membrane protein